MRQDFGWSRSAQAYVDLYRSLLGEQTAAAPGEQPKEEPGEEPQDLKLIA